MFASLTLIALAAIALRRFGHGRWLSWVMAVSIVAIVALTGIDVAMTLITGEGVNGAVFYHLKTGLAGGDVSQYAWAAAGAVAALMAVVFALWWGRGFLRPRGERASHWRDAVIAGLAAAGVALHPVPVASAQYALRFSLVTQHADGFVEPARDASAPSNPKNLVILYLESVERTYMNAELFPDLTPNLSRLEERAISFTDVGQTTGAGFTIGGMVATQCGVPLILSGGANSMRVSRFLNGATCLGDILSEAGYRLSYLGGASIDFAGKGAFYRSHGYDEVTGLDQLLPTLPEPDYRAEWGIQDDTLFDLARDRFETLATGDAPFVLTMLTLDTHHPNGHADTNRACEGLEYGDGTNPMLNSVLCADRMTGKFVDGILSGPHAENTVVAVVSDHLAMVNTATDRLETAPRRNLMMLFDGASDAPRKINRPATTLDTAPTILGRLGFDVARMGLGVDLLGEDETLPERLGVAADDRRALDTHVMGFQSVYQRLWAFPDLSDGLYVNVERGEINLGHNAFRTPVLLSFDDRNTVTGATLGDPNADETLTDAALALPEGTAYLWIDECLALSPNPDGSDRSGDTCALAGQRNGGVRVKRFDGSGFHSEDDLATLLTVPADTSDTAPDTAIIERIGQARGDLPVNVAVPGLATGERGVLLQSSAFGLGASFIRRQTTETLKSGEDWLLGRGVTLAGITPEGRAEVLDRLDQCDPSFDPTKHAPWQDRIRETRARYVVHLVTVHDTAFCGQTSAPLDATLNRLDLPRLRDAGMREAYAAVIARDGSVREFANPEFGRVKVFLQAGGVIEPIEPGTIASPVKIEPAGLADVSLNPVSITPNGGLAEKPTDKPTADTICILPSATDTAAYPMPLAVGVRVSGSDFGDAISFGQGWWGQEPAGRWSGMTRTEFQIALPPDAGEHDLTLGLAAPGGQSRDVRVEYGGRVLADARLVGAADITFAIGDLPRGIPLSLSLALETPSLDCPAARATGDDPRTLGVMLKSVALSEGYKGPMPPFTAAIAHGGGRVGGAAITNSFEAIEANLSRFEVFEIDFSWTSDGELVCLHDWGAGFEGQFGFAADGALTHDAFTRLLSERPDRARNCDLDGLAGWMRANPDVRIVTDAKERPTDAHIVIADRHPDILAQFVPQAYLPEEIDFYRGLGFPDVIWTLYRYGADTEAVLREIRNRSPSAVTMPVEMANEGLLAAVRGSTSVPVYVHTVNDPEHAACLLANGVTGLYSDDLGAMDVSSLHGIPDACSERET